MSPDVTRLKGFPPSAAPVPTDAVAEQGWQLFESGFQFPVMVLRESALEHDIARMARWCAEHGVDLAPHGKTTLSPQILRRQVEAGAWAITAATAWQVRVMHDLGIRRVLLANELVEPDAISWLVRTLAEDAGFEALLYADSTDGVAILAAGAAEGGRPLQVLVEMGIPGGRTGCRTVDEALAVADAIRAQPGLALAGTAAYEGVVSRDAASPVSSLDPEAAQKVDRLLTDLRDLTEQLVVRGWFAGRPEIVVTAGGSLYFDRVSVILGAPWSGETPVRVVLRSGCTVTHDHGTYERGSPLGQHAGASVDPLRPALELWGVVLSRPEPDLALVGFGRRDAPFDAGFPNPLAIRGRDGTRRGVDPGMTVFRMNDQHAFVRVPSDVPLQVGELLACGISHPCTAFDKWRAMPLVDDEDRVTGAVDILL